MPLDIPNLDDRRWADLVEDARALIPRQAPRWTDHNAHDPGITFIELFEALLALAVLLILRARARGFKLRLPVADGTAIALAGGLAGILILIRMFERPVGQGLLALACAGIVAFGGIRDNAKRSEPVEPPPPKPARPNPLEGFGEAVEEATAPDRSSPV